MKHEDIVKLVKSMDVQPFTEENFGYFAKNIHGLFVPGSTFQEFYSAGDNELARRMFDFSEGKPEYKDGGLTIVEKLRNRKLNGMKWINVHFDNIGPGVWGYAPKEVPMLFGFIPEKAFYVAQQSGNGTVKMPYEKVFVKTK